LKLTRLVHAPRSVLRTQDDYRPLPPSSRYHAFIQPGGSLAERIGLESGQFELRLGAPVETGRSWELPAALAHWVQSAGHSLDPETAELVVWATGALDNDLSVLSHDYHLSTKLERSEALLQSWLERGIPVLLLLPGEVALTASLTGPMVTAWRVQGLSDAIAAMQPSALHEEPVISAPQSFRRRPLLLVGTAALLLSAVFWLSVGAPPTGTANDLEPIDAASLAEPVMVEEAPSPQPDGVQPALALDGTGVERNERPQPPSQEALNKESRSTPVVGSDAVVYPEIVLEQAPAGSSCRAVLFSQAVPQRVDLIAVEGTFGAIADGDACALEFRLPDVAPEAADIRMSSALADLVLSSDRQVHFVLAPGEDRRFRLRARLPARIETDVAVTRSGHDPAPLRIIIERR
jgi:hypothetical protein